MGLFLQIVRKYGGHCGGYLLQDTCEEEEVDEVSYGQLDVASWSQALILLGDFNHPDFCWRDNTAQHRQSRKLLQITENKFLIQVVEEPRRRRVLLDLVLPNQKALVKDGKVGESLGCSNPCHGETQDPAWGSKAVAELESCFSREPIQPLQRPT